ncbi:unnamed protein product [Acanthosepion pharaonis]|uniref:Uncharacterized protein n=1 Tax=Acanthosepion pharaonis TaxID=158019 RepID=A0A812DTW8_ACAPH|nr:unnamed protein product [Sepia pharaonis]
MNVKCVTSPSFIEHPCSMRPNLRHPFIQIPVLRKHLFKETQLSATPSIQNSCSMREHLSLDSTYPPLLFYIQNSCSMNVNVTSTSFIEHPNTCSMRPNYPPPLLYRILVHECQMPHIPPFQNTCSMRLKSPWALHILNVKCNNYETQLIPSPSYTEFCSMNVKCVTSPSFIEHLFHETQLSATPFYTEFCSMKSNAAYLNLHRTPVL